MQDAGYKRSQGRIDRLEVENFKSYRGFQHIGPFKDFTAVIGPNGSGKSNLMDAISFVLGVRTNQLRGNQLRELLYSNSEGNTEEDKPRRGLVNLVFVTEEGGEEIAFSRHIQPSSSDPEAAHQSVYKINSKTVTWEAYSTKLGSFGILVKVRNFLVFQGDIEAVAAKSSQDLTHLFEQISGSDAFKRQYDDLQQSQMKTEEKVAAIVGKKRSIAAEKRQKKEQKEEAERHMQKQDQLRALKSHHLLFQLYHLHIEREAVKKAMRLKKDEQEAAATRSRTLEREVETLKKTAGGIAKDRLLKEKEMKKLQTQKDKKSPSLLSAKEEIARVSRRIKSGEKEVAELSSRVQERKKALSKLEKELAKIKEAKAALDKEIEQHYRAHASKASRMDAADVAAEYQAIKADVATKTSKISAECDVLVVQLQADEKALSAAEATQKNLQERAQALHGLVAEQQQRAMATRAQDVELKRDLQAKKAEIKQLQDANRRSSSERQILEVKLAEVESQLADARADRRENQRERKMAEAVDTMRRLFPGVHGRLTELGEVTQRSYKLALAVAMGRDVDSVVVDTERVAIECIQYLRDQKLPPMTFIPLNSCKVKPINEHLRTLGGSAKLAIDLIQFDPAYARAFTYVFENTLVCDSAEEARQWAYGGGERHKVVSRDGTLINKSGLITGGSSANHEARANRWDDGGIAKLKEQRDDLERRLQALPNLQASRQQEASLVAEVQGTEAKLMYGAAETQQAEEKARRQGIDAQQLEADAASRQAEIERLRAAVNERRRRVDALKAKVNEVADRLFSPFSKKVGVASIRQWEEQHAAFEAEVAQRRSHLQQQEAKLEGQIGYERGRDLDGPTERRQKEVEKDREQLAELESKVSAASGGLSELEDAMRDVQSQMEQLAIEGEKVEADLKEARKRGAKLGADVARLTGEISKLQAAAEQATTRARDIMAGALLEQVELPRKAGAGSRRARNAAGPSAMEVDGEEEAESSGAGEEAGMDVDAELALLDFSKLSGGQRAVQEATAREALEREFTKSISELAAELERSAPNMKALEQYDAVKEKEREQSAALEEARKEAREAALAFDQVRQSRHDAFTAAFRHIAASINDIYQDLTRSSVHKLGGTAYLSLENEDAPYLHGIKYTAMPPTKRFRDMEQLSGGEKTLASLALLFAIHSYRPSPFFVLDEVDAALDATNVARVAHYIRSKTRRSHEDPDAQPFQSIVISLKDIFYEKADALVGVARDGDQSCSRTFTFDLNRFEPPADA